ncbi:MAG: ferrochelatase [Planctomycetota bacterium]
MSYDAVLFVSFGGPEGPDEVMPFLENVLRGKPVPRERMLEVAEHYQHFGGVSPINAQNRALIDALSEAMKSEGPHLPIFWGNRNWHPYITDALREMKQQGVKRAIAFVTSAFSCYSGCRQYRENIQAARAEIGEGAPEVDKIRVYYNHPGFVEAQVDYVTQALDALGSDREAAQLIFTAHSIPQSMSDGSRYVWQLEEACRLVAERLNWTNYRLVYQSRSGSPRIPWLEPDICDYIEAEHAADRLKAAVIVPIGFISDHMEVLFDLDTEAVELCQKLDLPMVRAKTVGVHPSFVGAVRELIAERAENWPGRAAVGGHGPSHDVCPIDCCSYQPAGRPTDASARS